MRVALLLLASLAAAGASPPLSQPPPHSLLTNYNPFPLALDTPTPRLSWNNDFLALPSPPELFRGVSQVAFEIQVHTDAGSACSGRGCSRLFWASGQVPSLDPYTSLAQPLPSLTSGSWRVRVWSNVTLASVAVTIGPSPWSDPAKFETGPLYPGDWQHAPWLARDAAPPLDSCDLFRDAAYPLLRWRPPLPPSWNPAGARLYVTGLGYFRVFVNGKAVGKSALQPSWSNYNVTVPFVAFDVSSVLQPADNATIDIWLGAGW